MPDIEKVIKGLEFCRNFNEDCEGCPYEKVPPMKNCIFTLHDDALKLLKSQQKEIERIKRLSNEMAKVALYE